MRDEMRELGKKLSITCRSYCRYRTVLRIWISEHEIKNKKFTCRKTLVNLKSPLAAAPAGGGGEGGDCAPSAHSPLNPPLYSDIFCRTEEDCTYKKKFFMV